MNFNKIPPDVEFLPMSCLVLAAGRWLSLDILRPKKPSEKPVAVIVFTRWGGWSEGTITLLIVLPGWLI
jgi:hypothetical protein